MSLLSIGTTGSWPIENWNNGAKLYGLLFLFTHALFSSFRFFPLCLLGVLGADYKDYKAEWKRKWELQKRCGDDTSILFWMALDWKLHTFDVLFEFSGHPKLLMWVSFHRSIFPMRGFISDLAMWPMKRAGHGISYHGIFSNAWNNLSSHSVVHTTGFWRLKVILGFVLHEEFSVSLLADSDSLFVTCHPSRTMSSHVLWLHIMHPVPAHEHQYFSYLFCCTLWTSLRASAWPFHSSLRPWIITRALCLWQNLQTWT